MIKTHKTHKTHTHITKPETQHFSEMMSWFTSEQAMFDWAGPNFRIPCNTSTFLDDLRLDDFRSFSLVSNSPKSINNDNRSEFLAFGQYYLRLGKCHLARLIINPANRGEGVVKELITQLCKRGLQEFNVTECSLFVLTHNISAIKAYKKIGFIITQYPESCFGKTSETSTLENCLYMVK